MSALTAAFQPYGDPVTIKNIHLPFAANTTAWAGGRAAIDTAAAVVKPCASGNANLIPIGTFKESITSAASPPSANVTLDHEIVCRYIDSVTGAGAVTAANIFATVYMASDHEVTTSASGNARAGRVWGVDAVKGVLVENIDL